jgi:hypothetical protein
MKARSQFSLIRTRRSSGGKKARTAGETWDAKRVLHELRSLGTRRNVEGMARFGIEPSGSLKRPKLFIPLSDRNRKNARNA